MRPTQQPIGRTALLIAAAAGTLAVAVCIGMALRDAPHDQRVAVAPLTTERASAHNLTSPQLTTTAAATALPATPDGDATDIADSTYDIAWMDGTRQAWRTRIHLHRGPPAYAEVETKDVDQPALIVRYRAKIRREPHLVIIDAEGATVGGSLAQDWLPDSFRIAEDHSVRIDDGTHPPSDGWVVQVSQ